MPRSRFCSVHKTCLTLSIQVWTTAGGSIPGVTLNGQFLLEVNTYSEAVTVNTFQTKLDTGEVDRRIEEDDHPADEHDLDEQQLDAVMLRPVMVYGPKCQNYVGEVVRHLLHRNRAACYIAAAESSQVRCNHAEVP